MNAARLFLYVPGILWTIRGSATAQDLPVPEVELVSCATLPDSGQVRLHLAVTNAGALSAAFFTAAPPAADCGDPGATRLAVEIEPLSPPGPPVTLCRLTRADDLLSLRADLPRSTQLRVVLRDRVTGNTSAAAPVPVPPWPLPVLWSRRHGIAPAEALTDADGDGVNHFIEAAFGTDPRNAASVPRLEALPVSAGVLRFRWESTAGLRCRLRFSENLVNWQADGEIFTSGGVAKVAERPLASARFWQLEALAPVENDGDADGLTDYEEALAGTDPARADTDDDGVTDIRELLAARTNPLLPPSPSPFSAGGWTSAAIKQDGSLWMWGEASRDEQFRSARQPYPVGTARDWHAISTGAYHSLALKQNGELWAWGMQSHAQLGDVGSSSSFSPRRSGTDNDWIAAGAGGLYSIGLKRDGSLWGWGSSNFYQLAVSNDLVWPPVRIGSAPWAKISAGDRHVIAIRQDGTLWGWGDNRYGQAGGTELSTGMAPSQISTATDWIKVEAGNYHSAAIRADGSLWTWGYNLAGQIGNGTTDLQRGPVQVGADAGWKDVAVLDYATAALKNDGTVWTWGSNFEGQLGIGPTPDGIVMASSAAPVRLEEFSGCSALEAGWNHVLAVRHDGTMRAWGRNNSGQLGRRHHLAPRRIGTSNTWASGSASQSYCVFLRTEGSLWEWGRHRPQGNLTWMPQRLAPEESWSAASTSGGHSIARTSAGSLWSWGSNNSGQLGTGNEMPSPTPVPIPGETWQSVTASYSSVLAIGADTSLWGWGNDAMEMLGLSAPPPWRTSPYRIGTDTGWKATAIASTTAILLKEDGTLWAGGRSLPQNLAGLTHSETPVMVNASTDWRQISADGWGAALALKSDGTLWGWGDTSAGQLGRVAFPGNPGFARIGNDSDWKQAAISGRHAIGIKTDGSLWTWGTTVSGDNGFYNLTGPVPISRVGTDHDWDFVVAGGSCYLARKADGSLWSWGDDYYGQLGLSVTAEVGSTETTTGWAAR